MKNAYESAIENIAAAVPGAVDGDYTGQDGLLYCGKCHTPMQYPVTMLGQVRNMPIMCQCRREQVEAEERETARRERERLIENLRRDCFFDRELENCRFAIDDRKNAVVSHAMQTYADKWPEMRDQNMGLLLYGPVGTGKTFYAAAIANDLLDRGIPAHMTSFSRIINTMQGLYEGRQGYLDRIVSYPLLILDDLGAERNSEYMQEQVYNVVDARYKTGKPLIVTTNLDIEKIKNPENMQYQRIYDRILEICHPVHVNGASRRRDIVRAEYKRRNELLGL